MDVSYIYRALQAVHNEDNPERPSGYDEALSWVIDYIDANWDDLDELLDSEEALA